MRRFLPRTLLGQLIVGIIAVQTVLLTIFIDSTIRTLREQARVRSEQRMVDQLSRLTALAAEPWVKNDMVSLQTILETARITPTLDVVRVTDLQGNTLAVTASGRNSNLDAAERVELKNPLRPHQFRSKTELLEGVAPILQAGKPVALLWLEPSHSATSANVISVLRVALAYAGIALLVNLLPIILIVRSVTRPLRRLKEATQKIIRNPETNAGFPLPVTATNEVGELTRSFNTMVRELEEQRNGLLDTLALLDSMLGNAPIGFAFYDQKLRYVRLNQFLADIHGLSINRHLGRRPSDIYPGPLSDENEQLLARVFETGEAIRDIELSGDMPHMPGVKRSWLVNYYPVRTQQDYVRWVGVVVVEITERLQAEETLRRTEKLAAAGRLAASISHEINNPLEAVTNLLYLLRTHDSMDPAAVEYVTMAQAELARVSEITQQTLRFYRQSTFPVMTKVSEVLDSVITLYQSRITAARIAVFRRYHTDVEVFGFSGELRQLFANLVGNAVDAMTDGGRLVLTVRRGGGCGADGVWTRGVRIAVSDTGTGMSPETLARIFEAFFTTKDITGTGLGLWVSEEIIQKHGGRVHVRSQQGEKSGTTFMIFFPEGGLQAKNLADDAAKEAANA